jgi:hypothetical protein
MARLRISMMQPEDLPEPMGPTMARTNASLIIIRSTVGPGAKFILSSLAATVASIAYARPATQRMLGIELVYGFLDYFSCEWSGWSAFPWLVVGSPERFQCKSFISLPRMSVIHPMTSIAVAVEPQRQHSQPSRFSMFAMVLPQH